MYVPGRPASRLTTTRGHTISKPYAPDAAEGVRWDDRASGSRPEPRSDQRRDRLARHKGASVSGASSQSFVSAGSDAIWGVELSSTRRSSQQLWGSSSEWMRRP
jgi:hypothetical protein